MSFQRGLLGSEWDRHKKISIYQRLVSRGFLRKLQEDDDKLYVTSVELYLTAHA